MLTAEQALQALARLRAKYPEYNAVPHVELAQRVAAKYPEYTELATVITSTIGNAPKPAYSIGPRPEGVATRIGDFIGALPSATPVGADITEAIGQSIRGIDTFGAGTVARNAGERALQAAGTVAASVPKNVAVAAQMLDNVFGTDEAGQDARNKATYQIGQALEDAAKRRFPGDPRLQDDFLSSRFPEALGQMAMFVTTAALTKGAGGSSLMGAAVTGAGAQAVSEYEGAIDEGESQTEALRRAAWNELIGASEALPVEGMLRRAGSGRILDQVADAVVENALQGGGQQVASNIVAGRPGMQGVEEAAILEGLSGGVTSGAIGAGYSFFQPGETPAAPQPLALPAPQQRLALPAPVYEGEVLPPDTANVYDTLAESRADRLLPPPDQRALPPGTPLALPRLDTTPEAQPMLTTPPGELTPLRPPAPVTREADAVLTEKHMTPETGAGLAKQLGVEFLGLQEMGDDTNALYFQDPVTESSFLVPAGQSATVKLAALRKKFEGTPKVVLPPETPAVPPPTIVDVNVEDVTDLRHREKQAKQLEEVAPTPVVSLSPGVKPGAEARTAMSRHGADDSDLVDMLGQLRDQTNAKGDSIRVVDPAALTDAEKIAVEFGKERGARVYFTEGSPVAGGHLGGAVLIDRRGQGPYRNFSRDQAALWETTAHEVAHATGLDKLDLASRRILRKYEQLYLSRANRVPKYQEYLRNNPEALRREGVALLVGEIAGRPEVRRRLLKLKANLITRLMDSIRRTLGRLSGKTQIAERMLAEFETGVARPRQKGDRVQLLPKAVSETAGGEPESDGGPQASFLPDSTPAAEKSLLGKLRDVVGNAFVFGYDRPAAWMKWTTETRGSERLAKLKAERLARNFNARMKEAGLDFDAPATHKLVEKAIRGDIPASQVPPVVKEWVENVRKLIDTESLRAAEIFEAAGLPEKAATYRENIGKYLKNLPLWTLNSDRKNKKLRLSQAFGKFKRDAWVVVEGDKLRGKFETEAEARAFKKGHSREDRLQVLPPISEEERERLEVHDPRYLVARSLVEMRHDADMVGLFHAAAKKWGQVAPKGLTPDEADVWATENGLMRLPKSDRLHTLAGVYVPKAIGEDLTEMIRLPSIAEKIYTSYLSAWKASKTIWNPASHARNILGNAGVFSTLARTSPANHENIKHYRAALQETVAGESEDYDLLVRKGIIGTEYFGAEIKRIETQLKGVDDSKFLEAWSKFRAVHQKLGDVYAGEDIVFKLAAFKKYRAEGMTPDAAIAEVNKWFPNYERVGKLTKWLRNSPIVGSPFVSFMDQSVRIAGRGVKERPLRVAMIVALPGLLSYLSTAMMGMDDEEKEAWDAGRDYFQPYLPARDRDGRPLTLDLRYIIPLANDLIPEVRNGSLQIPWVFSGPVPSTIIEQLSGRERFAGRQFIKEKNTGAENAAARMKNVIANFLPHPTLATFGVGRIYKALADQEESVALAVIGAVGGVNIRSAYFADRAIRRVIKNMKAGGDFDQARTLESVYNRLRNDPKSRRDRSEKRREQREQD